VNTGQMGQGGQVLGQGETGLGTRGTGLRCLIYLVTKYMRHLRPVPLVPRPVPTCPI